MLIRLATNCRIGVHDLFDVNVDEVIEARDVLFDDTTRFQIVRKQVRFVIFFLFG
jgi:hypothetical protein